MQVVTELDALERGTPTILTIGAFDGVHRGHQWLVREVIQRAQTLGAQSMVLTFDPRPLVVLRPGSKQLTGASSKMRVLGKLGPEILAITPFSREVADIPAGEYLDAILQHVNLAEIWVGADFAFGHNREGTVDYLIRAGQEHNFAVHVVSRQSLHGLPISSTLVREFLQAGKVEDAAEYLGHFYRVCGTVVRGFGRGKALGYPTANLGLPEWQYLPSTGIYAAFAELDGRTLQAAVSVGYNPVFANKDLSVEAHLLDFDEELPGRQLCIDFVAKLRDERNFESVDALIEQMGRDVTETRQILAEARRPGEVTLPAL